MLDCFNGYTYYQQCINQTLRAIKIIFVVRNEK